MMAACWAAGATFAGPALRLMLRRRAARGKEIADRLPERTGIDNAARPAGPLIWFHAASVGETVSILPLLNEVAARCPATLLLTTGTVTSAALLAQRLPEHGLADRVVHRFIPLDVPRWVGNFLDHWQPSLGVLVESELWPNLIAGAQRRRIPLALINARMSDRSFRGWRRAPGLARDLLHSFTLIDAQSAEDARRLSVLSGTSVEASGNLKFAAPPLPASDAALNAAARALEGRSAWVAASLHPGEDAIIIAAHALLRPAISGVVTILVPRHPDRGRDIARLAEGALRSAGETPRAGQVWVADTLNELGVWYRVAPIALLGRSLVAPGGGQNPLEPARLGCAIATGPFTSNFADPMRILRSANAIETVRDPADLAGWVGRMLGNPAMRAEVGTRAAEAVQGHDHLPGRLAETLLGLIR